MPAGRRPKIALVAGVAVALLAALAGGIAIGRALGDDTEHASPSSSDRRAGSGKSTTVAPGRPDGEQSRSTTTTVADSTQPEGTVRGGVRFQELSVRQGLVDREYLVLSPADQTREEPLPVVVFLHGLTADRSVAAREGDWAGAVAEDRFVAVFPQGAFNSWNTGPCCPPASTLGLDDVAFIDLVADEVAGRADVDPDRMYLTGFSNGAIMAYTVACARPGLFAAVAPVAGTNLSGCKPPEPVPLLHLHGNPDFVVPYDGSVMPSQILSSADFPPVPDSVAAWAEADGCDPEPERRNSRGVRREQWDGCDGGSSVGLVTFPGNLHLWPEGEPLDATDEVLRFFRIR